MDEPAGELECADGAGLRTAACTIVSPNYFGYARTLAASYVAQHPEQQFFVLIVADTNDVEPFRDPSLTPVLLNELSLADVRGVAMKYDILELNTNVKPTFLKHLLARHALKSVIYLDPDIFVYARLEPVFAALSGGANAVLTPHLTTPVFDAKTPGEQEMLYNGTYNLGFFAAAATSEGQRLLDWWEERCLALGFSEGRTGLFVDQKWMNLAPGMFEGVAILRDAGCNMAYWNLHERRLVETAAGYDVESPVSGRVPLRFFHFSGMSVDNPASLSENTNRFTLADRPDLAEPFAAYKAAVRRNKDAKAEGVPYGFDRLSDGTAITRLARRTYAAHQERFPGQNPFDANAPFARFARENRLMKGKAVEKKQTWSDFNPKDRRVEMVQRALKLTLRLLGPVKYELLMRYLSHITVLRNQAEFIDRGLPAKETR
ncbi:MAG TPA: group 1 glycosyl transferase [Acidobacteriaceae bacterium]